MAISGILFGNVREAIAWARLSCPMWTSGGIAVWPFIRVAARGMVTCTHLACCQGEVPEGSVIRHLPGIAATPGHDYLAIKFHMRSEETPDVPDNLLNFDYLRISVHLRFLDLRGRRKRKEPSLFDGID